MKFNELIDNTKRIDSRLIETFSERIFQHINRKINVFSAEWSFKYRSEFRMDRNINFNVNIISFLGV